MEEPRIGVYICWCGTNISKMVDVESVSAEVANLPGVVLSKNYKYMCSDPGQELTFRTACEKAGINAYLFEMANIREQDSWVHTDRSEATKKAVDLVVAAIRRVRHHKPLEKRFVKVDPATMIIGGGISGMMAALEIADA